MSTEQKNITAVAIFEPQNVETIVQIGPAAFERNTLSHSRCIEAGQALLQRVNNEGMSDLLDKDIAEYIEKSKKTVKCMNERRSPVTKLFDQVRAAYTSLENDVDPAKSGTVAYQLQAQRNAYAAKKREEELHHRQLEQARIAHEQALNSYRTEVTDDYKAQFNDLVVRNLNILAVKDKNTTLENYLPTLEFVKNFSDEMPAEWGTEVASQVRKPINLKDDECIAIQASALSEMLNSFRNQYKFEIGGTREDILDRLPSKKIELQRMAAVSAEEAARIKANMEAAEAAELARKEAERLERERQEKAAAELAAQKREMDGLFGAPVADLQTYQPKTQVKKRIVISSSEDIMAIVGMWWSQEGYTLSIEELSKMFKKQITFCEKLANDKTSPMFISNVVYEDEVKAK